MKSPSLPTTVVPAWIVRVTPGLTLIRPSISQVLSLVNNVSAVIALLISVLVGVVPPVVGVVVVGVAAGAWLDSELPPHALKDRSRDAAIRLGTIFLINVILKTPCI